MRKAIYAFIGAVLVLTGCAGSPGLRTLDTEQASDVTSVQFKVFFAPSCPVSRQTSESLIGTVALSVASQVAGKLAGSAVDALGNYLSSTQAITFADTTRMAGFAASENGQLAHNSKEGCMIVVAAKDFNAAMSEKELERLNPFPLTPAAPDVAVNIGLNKVTALSGPALFYAEFTLGFNGEENQSAFTLIPRTWYYPQFVTPNSWRFSAKRDVSLRVEYSAPGDVARFAEFELKWTGVGAGEIFADSVIAKKLPWAPLPDGLLSAASKINKNQKVPIFPTNVKVMLVETAQPHTILKYTGEALKSQKELIASSVQDSVTQAFSQEARAAARSVAASDIEKKYALYVEAYDAASVAQQKYAAAPGSVAKQKALVAAKLAYLKLASAEVSVQASFSAVELGGFQALPALPTLP